MEPNLGTKLRDFLEEYELLLRVPAMERLYRFRWWFGAVTVFAWIVAAMWLTGVMAIVAVRFTEWSSGLRGCSAKRWAEYPLDGVMGYSGHDVTPWMTLIPTHVDEGGGLYTLFTICFVGCVGLGIVGYVDRVNAYATRTCLRRTFPIGLAFATGFPLGMAVVAAFTINLWVNADLTWTVDGSRLDLSHAQSWPVLLLILAALLATLLLVLAAPSSTSIISVLSMMVWIMIVGVVLLLIGSIRLMTLMAWPYDIWCRNGTILSLSMLYWGVSSLTCSVANLACSALVRHCAPGSMSIHHEG